MDQPAQPVELPSPSDQPLPANPLAANMCFHGTWRDYQQRVLDELDSLLVDERLHVVAAPGSGKTILGLEIMRRLGRRALILAPTRTVRDQWSSRLQELFLEQQPQAGSISENLADLGAVTVVTYQALHAYWSGDKSRFADLVGRLQALQGVTLILDEAHHLRREWWSALQALTSAVPGLKIVALTATPPYDAPYSEWARYEAMCGPIDLEIGIPELVRNGDLCPHQDQVIFSDPGEDALKLLDRRRERVQALQADLSKDAAFLDALEQHPWVSDPAWNVEAVLEAPEVLSSILVFLAASGRKLPKPPLEVLGVAPSEVPPPSSFWFEILLEGILFRFPGLFALPAAQVS